MWMKRITESGLYFTGSFALNILNALLTICHCDIFSPAQHSGQHEALENDPKMYVHALWGLRSIDHSGLFEQMECALLDTRVVLKLRWECCVDYFSKPGGALENTGHSRMLHHM